MKPIGVFDSGIGGVTVLKALKEFLPHENFIYYSDSLHNPYGNRSPYEILFICEDVVTSLLNQGCKAIVIACNTASAVAANFLRQKYPDLPIVAIEPAYKMVYDYSYDNPTIIMATNATIHSEKFHLLYEKFNNQQTILMPLEGLAKAIEDDNKEAIYHILRTHLAPYKGKITNVVLGCTHYPLIKKEIRDVLGSDIRFFDGGTGVAKHLKEVLEERNLLNDTTQEGSVTFIDSSGKQEKENRFWQIFLS